MDNLERYAHMMSWWHRKSPEQKLAFVGLDTLDKWVEKIVREEVLGAEAPKPALAECGASHKTFF